MKKRLQAIGILLLLSFFCGCSSNGKSFLRYFYRQGPYNQPDAPPNPYDRSRPSDDSQNSRSRPPSSDYSQNSYYRSNPQNNRSNSRNPRHSDSPQNIPDQSPPPHYPNPYNRQYAPNPYHYHTPHCPHQQGPTYEEPYYPSHDSNSYYYESDRRRQHEQGYYHN